MNFIICRFTSISGERATRIIYYLFIFRNNVRVQGSEKTSSKKYLQTTLLFQGFSALPLLCLCWCHGYNSYTRKHNFRAGLWCMTVSFCIEFIELPTNIEIIRFWRWLEGTLSKHLGIDGTLQSSVNTELLLAEKTSSIHGSVTAINTSTPNIGKH